MSIATELTALSGHITNAYDAVQTKGGTIPANKNMANLDDAILSIPAGADITNGVVRQYKSSASEISADTFVEFVENGYKVASSGDCLIMRGSQRFAPMARKISANKVLVFTRGDNASYRTIVAYAVDFSGGTITVGTSVIVFSSNAGNFADMCVLEDNKVFFAFGDESGGTTAGGYATGVVCTVSGTTVTVGTALRLSENYSSGVYTGRRVTVAKLSSTKVFASLDGGRYCRVCNISGTTITLGGTEHAVSVDNNTVGAVATVSEDRVLLVGERCAVLFGISNDNISEVYVSERFTEGIYSSDGMIYLVSLTPNNFILIYGSSNATGGVKARCYQVADDKVIRGENYSTITNSTGFRFSMAGVDGGAACITAKDSNSATTGNAREIIYITASNGVVSVVKRQSIPTTGNSSDYGTAVVDGDNFIVIDMTYASSSYNVYADLVTPDYLVRPSLTKINGVTIDDITTSTAGDVWVFADDVIYNGDADNRSF